MVFEFTYSLYEAGKHVADVSGEYAAAKWWQENMQIRQVKRIGPSFGGFTPTDLLSEQQLRKTLSKAKPL